MKISLAQMDIVPGKPHKNVEKLLDFIKEAKDQKADIVAAPEMCIGGYMIGDLYRDKGYVQELMSLNKEIQKASKNIAVIYGNVYADWENRNRDGRFRLYNAAYAFENGKAAKKGCHHGHPDFFDYGPSMDWKYLDSLIPHGVAFKTNLPTYRFFDDSRYFYSLADLAEEHNINKSWLSALTQPFMINNRFIGVELCEDIWCEDYFFDTEYRNPSKYLIWNGAEAIINLSASPWTYGKNGARHRRVKKVAAECKKSCGSFVPFFYVNCVGVQNNGKNIITFDGGTTIYNSKGEPERFVDEPYQEKLLSSNLDTRKVKQKPKKRSKIEEKYFAIKRGLEAFKDITGMKENPNVVIGLSGGIDSAVSAALFVKAFGKDKVVGINMPTEYNSNATKDAAKHTAKALGIKYSVIPIEGMVTQNKRSLMDYVVDQHPQHYPFESGKDIVVGKMSHWAPTVYKIPSVVQENMQAKIRGTSILSNIAQYEGGIWSNNGNKVEVALGYATLYGDWGGAISPLGDLTKAEVYEMAKHLNKVYKKEVISKKLIPNKLFQFSKSKIKPSAELRDEQVDPIKVGYHCSLIEAFLNYTKRTPGDILQWWLDGKLDKRLGINPKLITIYKLNNAKVFLKDLEWFCRAMRAQVFKRVQSVPTIVTSKTAFGYDLRESVLPPFSWTSEDKKKLRAIKKQKQYKPSSGD